MKRRSAAILDFFDSFLAYIMTIIGILFSAYLPLFATGTLDTLKIKIPNLVVSAVVALVVIGKREYVPGDNELARAGKRKNFLKRMGDAVAYGMMWSQIINIGGQNVG